MFNEQDVNLLKRVLSLVFVDAPSVVPDEDEPVLLIGGGVLYIHHDGSEYALSQTSTDADGYDNVSELKTSRTIQTIISAVVEAWADRLIDQFWDCEVAEQGASEQRLQAEADIERAGAVSYRLYGSNAKPSPWSEGTWQYTAWLKGFMSAESDTSVLSPRTVGGQTKPPTEETKMAATKTGFGKIRELATFERDLRRIVTDVRHDVSSAQTILTEGNGGRGDVVATVRLLERAMERLSELTGD